MPLDGIWNRPTAQIWMPRRWVWRTTQTCLLPYSTINRSVCAPNTDSVAVFWARICRSTGWNCALFFHRSINIHNSIALSLHCHCHWYFPITTCIVTISLLVQSSIENVCKVAILTGKMSYDQKPHVKWPPAHCFCCWSRSNCACLCVHHPISDSCWHPGVSLNGLARLLQLLWLLPPPPRL